MLSAKVVMAGRYASGLGEVRTAPMEIFLLKDRTSASHNGVSATKIVRSHCHEVHDEEVAHLYAARG